MLYIHLTGKNGAGKVTLVDNQDYDFLSQFKWRGFKAGNNIYAAKSGKNGRSILMHHMIVGGPWADREVDHRNRNTLDNQRLNLRTATRTQNARNSNKKVFKGKGRASSKYKGVFWNTQCKKWIATIQLGSFDSEDEAALAYNQAASKAFGEYGVLNEIKRS